MKKILFVALIFIGCNDQINNNNEADVSLGPRLLSPDMSPPVLDSDLPMLSWDSQVDAAPPDAEYDQCVGVQVDNHELYCSCKPECCSVQEWFCPPQPDNAIQSMRVTIEICNDNGQQCEFGADPDCPPPQIINRSDCQITHACPPGSSRDFLRWFECQLEDGRPGRQRVLCDKGVIIHGPCIDCAEEEVCDGEDNDCDELIDEDPVLCEDECGPGVALCRDGEIVDCINREPSEDVCNFIDDDCDGLVDEGQRNRCNLCGELPEEQCDGADNDCDELTDEDLVRECETPCERGVEVCLGAQWVGCTARQPQEEQCDGLDNDCDGVPDEDVNCECTPDQAGVLIPCTELPLICGVGFKTCECLDVDCTVMRMGDCRALCSHLPEVPEECDPTIGQPTPTEICNNFDEDCDENVDENLSQACYTGPRDTLNVGICIPGEQTCQEGRWGATLPDGEWAEDLCSGEVVPQVEICNGADDDCDGDVDFGEEMRPTDILLIIDTSGSMDAEIRAVTTALSRFGQHFAAEDIIHWGLILGPIRVPHPDVQGSDFELVRMVSNIAPFEQFFNAFININPEDIEGGMEMLMDAVMLSLRNLAPLHVDLAVRDWRAGIGSEPLKDNFIVNWRQDADRIIIVFSDEDEQSYMNPEFHRNDVRAALAAAPNTKLYTFALAFYGWDELAVDSGGAHFNLTSNSQQMYNDLMTVLDDICAPNREEQGAMMTLDVGYVPVSHEVSPVLMCY